MEGIEDRTRLAFYEIQPQERNIPAPPPPKNGGLYTGTPFLPGAPWGNVPIIAESHIHTRGAWAPHHIPGGLRGENNVTVFPYHKKYDACGYYIQCHRMKY